MIVIYVSLKPNFIAKIEKKLTNVIRGRVHGFHTSLDAIYLHLIYILTSYGHYFGPTFQEFYCLGNLNLSVILITLDSNFNLL